MFLQVGLGPGLDGHAMAELRSVRHQSDVTHSGIAVFVRSQELPHIRGQGLQPRGATLHPRLGTAAERSYPMPEARGCGREQQPHLQGVVAVRAQEGLEELFCIQGQKRGQR